MTTSGSPWQEIHGVNVTEVHTAYEFTIGKERYRALVPATEGPVELEKLHVFNSTWSGIYPQNFPKVPGPFLLNSLEAAVRFAVALEETYRA